MKKQIIIYLIILVAFLGTYLFQGVTAISSTEIETIRIGYFPNLTHTPALIAKNQKTLEKELGNEIKVEWHQFNDGPAVMEAIFAGEIDFSYIGPGPAISAYMKSKGEIVIVSGVTEGGAILISSKGSDINSLRDLSGKKVSVPKTGSTQEVALRGMMEIEDVKDVDIVQAKNADVENLIENDEIDAAFVVEPWGSLIEEKGEAKIIIDNDKTYESGEYPTTVLIGNKDYIEKNKDIYEKFLKKETEIINRINSDRQWARDIVSEEMKILTKKELSDNLVDKAFTRMIFKNEISRDVLLDMLTIQNKSGMTNQKDKLEDIIFKNDR